MILDNRELGYRLDGRIDLACCQVRNDLTHIADRSRPDLSSAWHRWPLFGTGIRNMSQVC